ncbi:class I SAM-dependent methyltransferase [Mariprofundus sp. EBB-1]|nr:class I SAM-dependent methyltransferase [Mariprofundus sp. EBB-1]
METQLKNNDRHNYEYDVDLNGDTAPARVVRMVGDDKRVLEVGAGPGSITKMLKGAGNCQVTGLEIDDAAIVKLTQFCEKVYKTDLNDQAWPEQLSGEKPFDVIVAADVLEHVYDPLAVLSAMAGLAGLHGEVVISLPHVGHNAVIACILDEDFQYGDWGLLDRTHIRFFGLKNMQQLFADAGLKIVDAQFVITRPKDSEFAGKWAALAGDVKSTLQKHKHGQVYQVVIRAVASSRTDTAIDLMSVPVENADNLCSSQTVENFARRIARKYLSDATRMRIRSILGRK